MKSSYIIIVVFLLFHVVNSLVVESKGEDFADHFQEFNPAIWIQSDTALHCGDLYCTLMQRKNLQYMLKAPDPMYRMVKQLFFWLVKKN